MMLIDYPHSKNTYNLKVVKFEISKKNKSFSKWNAKCGGICTPKNVYFCYSWKINLKKCDALKRKSMFNNILEKIPSQKSFY